MKARYIFIMILLGNGFIHSQCYPDRHSSSATDGWISCEKTMSPDPQFGETHWIQYDFGESYDLHNVTMWNASHPKYLKDGIKEAIFSYSNDGSTYVTVDTFSIARGILSSYYGGAIACDLKGINARYILITSLENHGGDCVGFSEIKFRTGPDTLSELTLDFNPCENGGIYKNISGYLNKGGSYTGMGVSDNGDETFDFDPDKTGAGLFTISYTYNDGGEVVLTDEINVLACGNTVCPDCIDCGNYDSLIINDPDIPTDIYHDEILESEGEVWSSSDVTFRGNEEVTLNPGFEVQTSSDFLAEIRECYINLMDNGDFEEALENWTTYVGPEAEGTFTIVTDEVYEGEEAMQIEVTDSSSANWQMQLIFDGIALDSTKTYKLSFATKGEETIKNFYVVVQLNESPWTQYFVSEVRPDEFWNTLEYIFESEVTTSSQVRVSFYMALFEGISYLDQVKLIELD